MNFVRTIVLVILVALLVCGCASSRVATNPTTLPDPSQTIGVYSNVLTDELKKEIEDAWMLKTEHPMDWNQEGSQGFRYYGTYNGFTILFEGGMLCSFSGYRVGDMNFNHTYSCAMLAYHDGEFLDLNEVYSLGYISDADVQQMKQIHVGIQKKLYDYEYDW